MWNQSWSGSWGPGMMSNWGWGGFFLMPMMLLLIVWTIYWKYHALWYAAKHDDKRWFLALLVINTLGILEILYLYHFSRQRMKHDEHSLPMIPPQS